MTDFYTRAIREVRRRADDRCIPAREARERGVLSDHYYRTRNLHRPIVPLGEERLQTEHQPIQTRQPSPKFIIELLVGAPLREAGIEVLPVWHRPDCDLSTVSIPARDIDIDMDVDP